MKSFYLVSVRYARGFRSNLFGFACTFAGDFKANYRAGKENKDRHLGLRFRFAAPQRKSVLHDRFNTSGRTATYKLGNMILPQLENGTLGAKVSAMLFFDDNNFILRKGDPIGERLAKIAAENQILLVSFSHGSMECGLSQGNCCGEDSCTLNKPEAVYCIENVACGCWADFFAKCKADGVYHIITL